MMPKYSTEDKVNFLRSIGYMIQYSGDFVVKLGGGGSFGVRDTYNGRVVITSPLGGKTTEEARNYKFTIDQIFQKETVIAFSQLMRDNILLAREEELRKAGVSRVDQEKK